MKKRFFLFFTLFMVWGLISGQEGPKLKFSEGITDLGIIFTDELEVIKMEIPFSNTGDKPLVLTNARGCCGTRIIEWTREPINPGEEGKITIQFRPAPRPHRISRTVSVLSNDSSGQAVFRIRGEVKERSSTNPPGIR